MATRVLTLTLVALQLLAARAQEACENTHGDARNDEGLGCQFLELLSHGHPIDHYSAHCDGRDNWEFTAREMCCTCGGGSGGEACENTEVWMNEWTTYCGEVDEQLSSFYRHCVQEDDDDFTARQMCCMCGGGSGGEACENTDGVATSADGNSCQALEANWDSDLYSYCEGEDDEDFTARQMCCMCGGGSGGEACENTDGVATSTEDRNCDALEAGYYHGYPSYGWEQSEYCEGEDDEDFTARQMCCMCGGGSGGEACENTDGDATSAHGSNCQMRELDWNEMWACSDQDDEDFTARQMCCMCGGGSGGEACENTDGGATSYQGHSCQALAEPYYSYDYYCDSHQGFASMGAFNARQMCCHCGGGTSWVSTTSTITTTPLIPEETGCHDVVVEAAQHSTYEYPTSLGTAYEFGFYIEAGSRLVFTSAAKNRNVGQAWSGNSIGWTDANGNGNEVYGFTEYSLVGSVGDGALFQLGTAEREEVVQVSGKLHLAFWDRNSDGNQGQIEVHVCVTRNAVEITTTTTREGCHDVTVEAVQHSAAPNGGSYPTSLGTAYEFGIYVERGSRLEVDTYAEGQRWSGNGMGWPDADGNGVNENGFIQYSLVGSVGDGALFQLGRELHTQDIMSSGELHLAFWDRYSDNGNAGQIYARVCVTPDVVTFTSTTATATSTPEGCHSMTVSAVDHGSDGDTELGTRHDMGIYIEEGSTLHITAPGDATWAGRWSQMKNADGSDWSQNGFTYASLVGSVGDGALFQAGTYYEGLVTTSGNLHFAFWDSDPSENEGEVSVYVCVVGPTTTRTGTSTRTTSTSTRTTITSTSTTITTVTTTVTSTEWTCVVGNVVQVKCHNERIYHPALVHSCAPTGIVVAYAVAGHTYYCTPEHWRVEVQDYVDECEAYGGIIGKNGRCCPATCGECGGYSCHLRPGGGGECCTSQIPEAKVCGVGGRQAPCALPGSEQTPEVRRLGSLRGAADSLYE